MLDVAMLLGGGVLLYFGAEWLVGGAAGLARSLGVSALVVGLTVVAYGTSAPEIVVGVQAATDGHPAIALGNVVGSNVANLGLILGLTTLVRPARVDGAIPRREVPMLVVSALAVPLVLLDGVVSALEASALLAAAGAYGGWMVRTARTTPELAAEAGARAAATASAADEAGAPEGTRSRGKLLGTAGLGLVALVLGGRLFVGGATGLALALGMSERLVGLTIVAVGTSLPELATSLIAARRGHSDIAVGNVVGSNVFNVLGCLALAGLAGPVGAPLASVALDVGAMVVLTLLAVTMMRTARTISRPEGALLVLLYVAFLVGVGATSEGTAPPPG